MPLFDAVTWSDRVRHVLQRYDEPLLRQVATRLFKPRNQWPVEELIDRNVATLGNVAVIDRRLEALAPEARRLLAFIGHSRQPLWPVGNLVELLVSVGSPVDLQPIFDLLQAGLLYPQLTESVPRLKSFEQWLGQGQAGGPAVFAHPHVTDRALGQDLGLPACPVIAGDVNGVHEADGLEWPLRLAVVWQQVAAGPLRRTQQGDYFKRDLDRLRADPLLNGAPADSLDIVPDSSLLAVELALIEGVIQKKDEELRAGTLPAAWEQGLLTTLESLWASLPRLYAWNAHAGWRGVPSGGNPYPSAYLLAMVLLAHLPEGAWAEPSAVEQWVLEHHPYWAAADSVSQAEAAPAAEKPSAGLSGFLLGLAYQWHMLQAARAAAGQWVVRLSPTGRWLLGLGEKPAAAAPYTQTLLVQPNLEVIAYRQGLTPALIGYLSQFAEWKSLGAACTLQLEPDSVYRGLEAGQTFETMLQTLERHGMRPTPAAVVESLRTWANKRERLGVYPSATLFEFNSAEDLNDALARGLPAVRLSDRLAVVADEQAIDFRHFRLVGTRDYGLPPEKCVDIEDDGVTLSIDLARSDLLLDTELPRFAELINSIAPNGRRQYRLTPASLANGREQGLGLRALEEWFLQRAGRPLPAAPRLLLTAGLMPPQEIKRQLVLHVSAPEVADGLLQWPATRALIAGRLGPAALAVTEENLPELQKQLAELGLRLQP